MDPDQDVLLACYLALDNRHMAQIIQVVAIGDNAEMAVFGWQVRLGDAMHHFFMAFAIRHEGRHGNEDQAMLFGKLDQIGRTGHVSVFLHDFAADTDRCQARQGAQVCRGFRMSRPHQDPSLAAPQGKDMPRTAEIAGLGSRFGAFLHGIGPFISRNACRRILVVDGNRKRRLMVIRVVDHHGAELQFVHDFRRRRHTDQPAGLLCHKVDIFACAELGGHDQVAFVFPILVVRHQDHFALLDGVDGFLDGVEFEFLHRKLLSLAARAAGLFLRPKASLAGLPFRGHGQNPFCCSNSRVRSPSPSACGFPLPVFPAPGLSIPAAVPKRPARKRSR